MSNSFKKVKFDNPKATYHLSLERSASNVTSDVKYTLYTSTTILQLYPWIQCRFVASDGNILEAKSKKLPQAHQPPLVWILKNIL